MPGRELHDEVRRIVDEAIERLQAEKLSRSAGLASRAVLAAFKRRRDYDGTMKSIDQLRMDLSKIQQVLDSTAEELRQAEQRAGDRSPGSEIWWNTRIRSITDGLGRRGGTEEGLLLWREAWVQGLTMGAWEDVWKLLRLTELPDSAVDEREQMALVTEAVQNQDAAQARLPIERLLNAYYGDAQWTAVLGVLRSRAMARTGQDRDPTIQAATQTLDALDAAAPVGGVSAQDAARSRALALTCLAEVLLRFDELDEAEKVLSEARTLHAQLPDTLVAAGMLAERRQAWVDADQFYESALAKQPDLASTPRLLQPAPAGLLVRAAADAPPADAVPLLQRALDLGIAGDGDYPDRDVHLALAAALQAVAEEQERSREPDLALESRRQAAQAYADAASRYSWSGLGERSIELFGQAVEAAPDIASPRWNLAEALRLGAYQSGARLDTEKLQRARDEMRLGLELETPSPDDAWVLVTKAMIDLNLPDAIDDAALTIERSVILSLDSHGDRYAVAFGFLAIALRQQGYLQEAHEAALQGDSLAPNEGLVVRQLLTILRDLGDYDEALERVDRQLDRWPEDQELILHKALTLARLERYDEALVLLDEVEPTGYVRLERAYVLNAMDDEEASRAEFRALALDTDEQDEPDIAAWSAYRIGELETAIRIYEPLLAGAAAEQPHGRNFGQLLLVQGDIERARDLLLTGIDACPYVDELIELRGAESRYLRQQLDSVPHQRAAEEVLALVDERAERRIQELRTRRRPSDTLAVRVAEARTALLTHRFDEALASYVGFALSGELPEAPSGVRGAGELALDAADKVCRSGERDSAIDAWLRIAELLEDTETTGGGELIDPLLCRGVLGVVQAGRADPEQIDALDDLLTHAPEQLAEAAEVLCSDIPALWDLDDALRALLASEQRPEAVRDNLKWILDQLPLSRVYGTTRESSGDLLSDAYIPPLALRFGKDHENLAESGELAHAVAALQERVSEDVGVRVPWIYFQLAEDLEPDEVEFQVYERSVQRDNFDPTDPDLLRRVIDFTEAGVLPNLFRTVGVDDVSLWLEGWDLNHLDAPAWDQVDPLADRLRLARVLRLLLREGVTVADRPTIVGVLEASGRAGDQSTLRTLREVRARLGGDALGAPRDADVQFLSDDLEARIAAGLNEKGTVWELPRGDARALVEQLRQWLSQLPEDSRVIGVEDARIRPFVWRLLAAERPLVRVLAEEELSWQN